ncbi:hypothetical protein F5880DRAFT_1566062 [Lentinula raphanica]|nr:hypothetical protein F5880DRAFT_1566062 [Lentinula raphanica]
MMKPNKLKAPKFKIKEYKNPGYSKYVVVTNPWSKPTASNGHRRRENPEMVKERFANTIGGWFEKMTGKRVETIYFQSTKEFIIVELDNSVDVDTILGAHHTQDFFKDSMREDISEIYVYNYQHQGCPNTILKWESISPNYDATDLTKLRVKEKAEYPPPRMPKLSKPPTHFAQKLTSEIQELVAARRASYEQSLAPSSSIQTSLPLNQHDSSTSESTELTATPQSAFIPYAPPTALAAMRSSTTQDPRLVRSLQRDNRSVTLSEEPNSHRMDAGRRAEPSSTASGRHTTEVNSETIVEIKPGHSAKTQTPALEDAASNFLNTLGRELSLSIREEPDLERRDSPIPSTSRQPKIENSEDVKPKIEEAPVSHEEYIRLWHLAESVRRRAEARNDQLLEPKKEFDTVVKIENGEDRIGRWNSSYSFKQAKVEGSEFEGLALQVVYHYSEEPSFELGSDRYMSSTVSSRDVQGNQAMKLEPGDVHESLRNRNQFREPSTLSISSPRYERHHEPVSPGDRRSVSSSGTFIKVEEHYDQISSRGPSHKNEEYRSLGVSRAMKRERDDDDLEIERQGRLKGSRNQYESGPMLSSRMNGYEAQRNSRGYDSLGIKRVKK